MFSTFTSFLCLCLCLQSTFSKELVIILASDKETLKNSLVQVDQFLEKVGQRIQNERNFLHTAGSGTYGSSTGTVTAEGESNEDYSNLWFGGKGSFQNKGKNDNYLFKSQNRNFLNYTNFAKAFATFNENEVTESTKKLIHAVADLQDLVEHADVKNELPDNPDAAERREILRQIQETLRKREEKMKQEAKPPKLRKSEDVEEDNGELDIFKSMEFPEKSNFPFSVSVKTTEKTTTNTLPDILSPGFMTKEKDSGPGAEILTTPSTTTDSDEELLDPKEFGYTTTHKPLPTFGDARGSPYLDERLLTTKPPDSPFVASLKQDMTKFSMGVFSIAMLKIFHMVIWKKAEIVKALVWGFKRIIENKITFNHLRDFGPVTEKALDELTINAYRKPYDQLRADAILMHHALLHRREMFTPEVNYILDELDSFYTKKEAAELLQSLEPLDQFDNPKITPFSLIDKMIKSILAPINRLAGAPRREGLIVAITKAVKTHFYATKNIAYQPQRRNAKKIPLEVVRPTVNQDINKIYWEQMKLRSPIKNNKYSALSEEAMNLTKIITTDLRNINNNLMNNKESNTDKSNDDSKPRAIFRTRDHYVDERIIPPVSNNSILNDDFNMLDMDNMYRDYKDNVASELPVTNVVGFKMNNNNRLVNDNMMIEGNRKKPDNVHNVQKFDQGNYPMPTVSPTQSPGLDLKMGSDSTRHHRKRHHRKRRHHMSIRQKLAKIKRILKLYRSGSHHRRFRHRHHHKHNKRKTLKSLDIRPETNKPIQPMTTMKTPKNASKPINDKFYQAKITPTTTKPPNSRPSNVKFFQYTTQVYEVKDKFHKVISRRNFNDDLKKLIDMSFVRKVNEGSDEEVSLKSNLYKAMDLKARSGNQLFPRARTAKRDILLRESSGSDEEAQLKKKIYNYFNEIQPD